MVSADRKVLIAFFIALAGLALTVVSALDHQQLIAALGALVTIVFVVCVTIIERQRQTSRPRD